jgi:hypothetical protein
MCINFFKFIFYFVSFKHAVIYTSTIRVLEQVKFKFFIFQNSKLLDILINFIKIISQVVNQQPFGGARLSGTNDKPGSPHYLLKWTSPLSEKRFLLKQTSYKHPSML